MSRLPRRVLRRFAGEPLVVDGRTLDLQIHAFASQASKRAAKTNPSPKGMRSTFDRLMSATNGSPDRAVAVHNRTLPSPAGALPARIYHPPSASGNAPAIVWFHQGGGVIGGLDTDHSLCSRLSRTCGAMVISVDYRLAPEHRFPAGIEDALWSYQWVVDNAGGLGIDQSRIAVGGASTGATFAAVVCQERRTRGGPQPVAQILAYPDIDGTATGGSRSTCAECFPLTAQMLAWFATNYLPDLSALNDHRVSPGLNDELWGLARAVVVTAGFDPLRDAGDGRHQPRSSQGNRSFGR